MFTKIVDLGSGRRLSRQAARFGGAVGGVEPWEVDLKADV